MEKNFVQVKPCKQITTKHTNGSPNGWLLEVQSDRDGFTEQLVGSLYLSVVVPGTVKGYHIHAVAMYHITCIKGRIRSTVYRSRTEKEVVEYGDGDFKTIKYLPGCAHLIENIGDGPAYVLIYRYPSWSSGLPEQLDIPPEEIETDAAWSRITAFVRSFDKTSQS